MNFQSHFLDTYLILLFFSPRGAMAEDKNVVCGVWYQSISLDIPEFLKDQDVDDIRWFTEQNWIAEVKQAAQVFSKYKTDYDIFPNGTLRIKTLKDSLPKNYKVSVYHKNGTNLFEKKVTLCGMEAVTKPQMMLNCTKKSVTCGAQNGSRIEMIFPDNKTHSIKREGLMLTYTWEVHSPPPKELKCVVKNRVSSEYAVLQILCTANILGLYHILAICGGVIILVISLALHIYCRKKNQSKKINATDQNLEIMTCRVNVEDRGRKLPQTPGQHSQPSGSRHPQPSGGHRSQAAGHRPQVPVHCPPVPAHRPQQQQQQHKRPHPKTQQQTGPPLPKPRNQQKSPYREKGKL